MVCTGLLRCAVLSPLCTCPFWSTGRRHKKFPTTRRLSNHSKSNLPNQRLTAIIITITPRIVLCCSKKFSHWPKMQNEHAHKRCLWTLASLLLPFILLAHTPNTSFHFIGLGQLVLSSFSTMGMSLSRIFERMVRLSGLYCILPAEEDLSNFGSLLATRSSHCPAEKIRRS